MKVKSSSLILEAQGLGEAVLMVRHDKRDKICGRGLRKLNDILIFRRLAGRRVWCVNLIGVTAREEQSTLKPLFLIKCRFVWENGKDISPEECKREVAFVTLRPHPHPWCFTAGRQWPCR